MRAWMVYHQSADSYHSTAELPIAVFTGEDALKRAEQYADNQNGYGKDIDWFVKPVALNPEV